MFPTRLLWEGPKAGGHLGFKPAQIDNPDYALEHLVADVINEVKPIEEQQGKAIPVIAAGAFIPEKISMRS